MRECVCLCVCVFAHNVSDFLFVHTNNLLLSSLSVGAQSVDLQCAAAPLLFIILSRMFLSNKWCCLCFSHYFCDYIYFFSHSFCFVCTKSQLTIALQLLHNDCNLLNYILYFIESCSII